MAVKIKPETLSHRFDPRLLPSTPEDAYLIAAAPAMFKFLALMAHRPGSPARIDIERCLSQCGIEVDYGDKPLPY